MSGLACVATFDGYERHAKRVCGNCVAAGRERSSVEVESNAAEPSQMRLGSALLGLACVATLDGHFHSPQELLTLELIQCCAWFGKSPYKVIYHCIPIELST